MKSGEALWSQGVEAPFSPTTSIDPTAKYPSTYVNPTTCVIVRDHHAWERHLQHDNHPKGSQDNAQEPSQGRTPLSGRYHYYYYYYLLLLLLLLRLNLVCARPGSRTCARWRICWNWSPLYLKRPCIGLAIHQLSESLSSSLLCLSLSVSYHTHNIARSFSLSLFSVSRYRATIISFGPQS